MNCNYFFINLSLRYFKSVFLFFIFLAVSSFEVLVAQSVICPTGVNVGIGVPVTGDLTVNGFGVGETDLTDLDDDLNAIYPFNGASLNFDFRVEGTANFTNNGSVRSGVRVFNQTTSGGVINVQANNTNFDNGDIAIYTLTFTEPVTNVNFSWTGLDFGDVAEFQANNNGTPVAIAIDNFNFVNGLGGAVTTIPGNESNGTPLLTGNGTTLPRVTTSNNQSPGNDTVNGATVNVLSPITQIVIRTAKRSRDNGNRNNGNVTMQFSFLSYCVIDNPIDDDDEILATNEDTVLTGDLFANLVDADSNNHNITSANVDLDGDGVSDALSLGNPTLIEDSLGNPIGEITVNADGSFTFEPALDYNGAVPNINYDIVDNNDPTDTDSSVLSITVTPVNDAPVATDDTQDILEDEISVIRVLDNDVDPDNDLLAITEIDNIPVLPGDSVTLSDGTIVTLNNDGTLSVNPVDDSVAPISFVYTISDGNGGEDEGQVNLMINSIPLGTVSGIVYNDEDNSGTLNGLENGFAGVDVFADLNNNNIQDIDEPSAITAIDGSYTIADVPAGSPVSIIIDITDLPLGAIQSQGTNPTEVTLITGGDVQEEENGFNVPTIIGIPSVNAISNEIEREGDTFEFTITLDRPVTEETQVEIVITDRLLPIPSGLEFSQIPDDATIQASDDNDFNSTGFDRDAIIVTFNAGESEATFSVATTDDTENDPYETFEVSIGNLLTGMLNPTAITGTGVIIPESNIVGHLYFDYNANGTQETNEINLEGVQLNVVDALGNIFTVLTDAQGDWRLDNLPFGETTSSIVLSTLPNGVFQTENTTSRLIDVNNDLTSTIVISDFTPRVDSFVSVDGFAPSLILLKSGVYVDVNGNGIPDVEDEIQYNYRIVNQSTESITDIVLTDDILRGNRGVNFDSNGNTLDLLNAGEEFVFTSTYNPEAFEIENNGNIITLNVESQASVSGMLALGSITITDNASDNLEAIDLDFTDFDSNQEIDDSTVVTIEALNVLGTPPVVVANTGVSPNSGTDNDVFTITGIENFENTVKIYNRWGVEVFEVRNYNNEDPSRSFRGRSEGRITVSADELLPVGTYFYVITYTTSSGNEECLSGYLYINR